MSTSSSHNEGHEPMSVLYEASYTGNVSILNSLIQQNPLILFKISQTSFTETPLHISALLGHVDFTKALLSHNPKLALELDTSRSTPLHVASAEGHVDVVKELLKAKSEACLFADKEGKIPLHYAAIRGRTEVVKELIRAKPKSLSFRDINGKTVFHLCVTYNHLETLKALVELELHFTGKLINFTSSDNMDGGNTVLHLAIMLKQVQVVRYLVTVSEISEVAGKKNKMGLTVHDMVKRSPKDDYKILEIQVMLMNAGVIEIGINNNVANAEEKADQKAENCHIPVLKSIICWCLRILKRIVEWFQHEDKWIKQMRGNLSLVSTVIATITFQALLSSPKFDEFLEDYFLLYVIANTVSFVSSLSVTLLLVSGFPLKNKAFIWVLSLGLCFAVSALAVSYLSAFYMVIPDKIWSPLVGKIYTGTLKIWLCLLGLIGVIMTIRFFIWVFKMSNNKRLIKSSSLKRERIRENGCC